MSKPKSILAIHMGKREDLGPCEMYRITTPMHYLSQRPGWNCQWIPFTELYTHFLKDKPEENLKMLADNYDAFVWARTYVRGDEQAFRSAALTLEYTRRYGVKHIYEVDDDYTNQFRNLGTGDAMSFASWCDAVTVTTPYLAATMKERTGMTPHVLPNMLDPHLWQPLSNVSLVGGKIRITLSGSTTHHDDWAVLGGVLQRIAAKYDHVSFLIGGFHPEYLHGIPNAEYIPPVPYHQYLDLIKHSDIILCPVNADPFNLGKSPIKATEGQGAARMLGDVKVGAAVIATDNPVYRIAIPNDQVGVLVQHTPEAWEQAIVALIEDTDRRHALQRDGYKFVWKNFNLETGWLKWAQAYNHVLSKPQPQKKLDYANAYQSYRKSFGMSDGVTG